MAVQSRFLLQLTPLIQREMLGIDNIRHQFGPLGLQDAAQLSGDLLGRRLKRAHPGKHGIRMELALRQFRIVKLGRLTVVDLGTVQDVVAKTRHAPLLIDVGSIFAIRHGRLHRAVALIQPLSPLPFRMLGDRGDLWRKLPLRPGGHGRIPCRAHAGLIEPFQQACLHQQCGEIARRKNKGLANARESLARMPGRAVERSELEVDLGLVRA